MSESNSDSGLQANQSTEEQGDTSAEEIALTPKSKRDEKSHESPTLTTIENFKDAFDALFILFHTM